MEHFPIADDLYWYDAPESLGTGSTYDLRDRLPEEMKAFKKANKRRLKIGFDLTPQKDR